MKKTPEQTKKAKKPARNGLRLIRCDEPDPIEEEIRASEESRPGLKNPLVQFMGGFADSLDDEIRRIMDL